MTLVPCISMLSGIDLRQAAATLARKQSLKQQLIAGVARSRYRLRPALKGPPVSRSRQDALAKMQIIVRRGTRYYLNELRVNSDSAVKRKTCHSVLAAQNKSLAKSNKSRTCGEATNK
jgi:hypothetical protein